jgi:hypothetical protein
MDRNELFLMIMKWKNGFEQWWELTEEDDKALDEIERILLNT